MPKDHEPKPEKLSKSRLKAEIEQLQQRMIAQQQEIRAAGLPVIVLVEGWAAAGKGGLINRLIADIDPRFADVFSADSALADADRYPFLYPYFKAIPEKGKFMFMDGGWLEGCVRPHIRRDVSGKRYRQRVEAVNTFERQLRDNGYLVVKLFVNISKSTQRERLEALLADLNTQWRVTDSDLWQHREYDAFSKEYEKCMALNGEYFKWNVLDGEDKTALFHEALKLIVGAVDEALANGVYEGEPFEKEFKMTEPPRLEDADLAAALSPEEYKKELKKYQQKLARLHNEIYRKRIPVVVCFEGWDAAGKGGAIRRLAKPLDPRGCTVYPIASPEPHEKNRHYLWRFWTRLPRSGHVAIFDRTWYGRVMVERLEGFCSENDWKRAYNEINEFEQELTRSGAVVLKFWLQIDSDTQLARFTDRQNTPEKQWKITDEDWRNREKWGDYALAISEMLEKTSTKDAPWHIIESVDKLYARIKVLKIVTVALEKALDEHRLG